MPYATLGRQICAEQFNPTIEGRHSASQQVSHGASSVGGDEQVFLLIADGQAAALEQRFGKLTWTQQDGIDLYELVIRGRLHARDAQPGERGVDATRRCLSLPGGIDQRTLRSDQRRCVRSGVAVGHVG
jgi:hypothetical protein